MELRERLELCRLKAVYGPLLTPRQRECLERCVEGDLSLSEIAENYGISRQGVRDVIVRAEAAMDEIEEKTHLIRRFHQSQKELLAIDEAADRLLQAVRAGSCTASTLEEIALSIKEHTAKLKQE